MIVTYSPEGGTKQQWPYDPNDLPYAEAELIEEVLDCTFEAFKVAAIKGGARAKRALLWVLLRRESPKLRFSDVQPRRIGELVVEYDLAEIERMREAALANDEMDDDDRAAFLRALDEASEEQEQAEVSDPKAEADLLPDKG